jgi:hypothetical protein
MGFNATRRYRGKKTTDLAILVSAIVIIAVLVGWVLAAGGR